MKKTLLSIVILLSLFALAIPVQSQNALYFDNIDDNVTVLGGSSLIANSAELSLSFWVYPENAFPTFPDYDGFAGIRNNVDADFYILQLAANSVEARFRNSAGVAYDIVFPGLILNGWQHFVMTYDGTNLLLYHNGLPAGSIAATGAISNPAEIFNIGNLVYQGTNFLTNGKIDEVSLWSKALTAPEITCIYNGVIDPSETDLQLYYKMNQGIAGGSNGAVTTALDATGNINGVLNGFALAGSASNWVAGLATGNSSTITDLLCPGTSYAFGSQTITSPGTYYEAFPTISGCDSVVELILTAPVINTFVGQVGPVLTSQQVGAVYQWIDCINANTPIPGAINQTYTATANGQYAVIVTLGNCSDTSVCITVTNVGINELSANVFSVYPNPFNDKISITTSTSNSSQLFIIYDALGKMIAQKKCNHNNELTFETVNWESGTYWIICHDSQQKVMVVKQ